MLRIHNQYINIILELNKTKIIFKGLFLGVTNDGKNEEIFIHIILVSTAKSI